MSDRNGGGVHAVGSKYEVEVQRHREEVVEKSDFDFEGTG